MTDNKERNIVLSLSITEYVGYGGPIDNNLPVGYSGHSGITKIIKTKEDFDAVVKQIKNEFRL